MLIMKRLMQIEQTFNTEHIQYMSVSYRIYKVC